MNLELVMKIVQIVLVLEIFTAVQTSHVRNAKAKLRHEIAELRKDARTLVRHSSGGHSRRFSGRRKAAAYFTTWTGWSKCDNLCIKSRERYCKLKRKCGHTKHIEEKYCKDCQATRHPGFDPTNPFSPIHPVAHSPVIPIHGPAHPFQTPPLSVHHGPIPTPLIHSQILHHQPQPVIEPISTFPSAPSRVLLPVFQEIHDTAQEDHDFFVIKKRPKYRKKRKPIVIEVDDYDDLQDEDDSIDGPYHKNYFGAHRKRIRDRKGYNNNNNKHNNNNNQRRAHHRHQYQQQQNQRRRPQKINYNNNNDDDAVDTDDDIDDYYNYYNDNYDNDEKNNKRNLRTDVDRFDYEDFGEFEGNLDMEEGSNLTPSQKRNDYEDEYTDDELYEGELSASILDMKNTSAGYNHKAVFETPPRYRRVYTRWSRWTKCSPKCTTRRYKKCRIKEICGKEVLREIAYCYTEGSFCQEWLENQMKKTQAVNEVKPIASRRKDVTNTNAISSDYVVSSKGYRGPEYRPLKLKCGIPNIRNGKRNMNNMLKIIGGKPSRKGEWPWQVVIFNRFKEAFCGGTLIAPRWILTAAHCVRKVLYVRLGEHNLDYQDGTEIEFRVVKSIKHPNYDKRTVDSDIALLRLPKQMNQTNWIGFSCIPRPYQPLPRNIQCTVIGWGKRRNRDQVGTSVLHQAEVPIIPMDNCKAVYYDYTITKNMFCAGHKRGRIDTCAGDSGGPLLCRDTTKPNHPWTIFGITSFGDGCAKKNKFGIYTKVPNYVDWVWSVINCNGNCRMKGKEKKN